VRENRMHSSEGGEDGSPSRPLSMTTEDFAGLKSQVQTRPIAFIPAKLSK
jgi:hypothetical protein